MAKHVRNTACPECGSRDNLGEYSDGSAWCWGCNVYIPPTRADRLQSLQQLLEPIRSVDDEDEPVLTTSGTTNFSPEAVQWLVRYDLTIPELLQHGTRFNERTNQLIFHLFDREGKLRCTQARNFSRTAKSKYTNVGDKTTTFPLYQANRSSTEERVRLVILTEDILSAVKVSRQFDSFPLLGTSITKNTLQQLVMMGYQQIIVWLDRDKWRAAIEIAETAKWLGVSARAIYTELDPKEFSNETIKRYIE